MYIQVKVLTKQKEQYINELKENYFEISVKEKPERNEANKKVIEILKNYFNKEKIKIINGHKNPKKLISIE